MKIDVQKLLRRAQRIRLEGWKRTAAYAAFFVLAFVWALHATFPVEAVKERIILEAAAQGWQVRLNDLAPSGLLGVRAREVTVQTRDGGRIPVDEARVSLRLLPTVMGRRAFNFSASIFDGAVDGYSDQGKNVHRFQLKATGLDLARAAVLRKATGLDLMGKLDASVDVSLDARDPAKNAGLVSLGVKGVGIKGGSVPVPGMGGGLTVPPVGLGDFTMSGTVKGPRADLGKIEARGGDVEITGEQTFVQLLPKVDNSPISGRARVRIADALWQKGTASALRPVIELGLSSARMSEGVYGFQIYGTLGSPQARPMAF